MPFVISVMDIAMRGCNLFSSRLRESVASLLRQLVHGELAIVVRIPLLEAVALLLSLGKCGHYGRPQCERYDYSSLSHVILLRSIADFERNRDRFD